MIEDPNIQETAHVLQETILDILRRRAVKEGLEHLALEKKVPYEVTLRIYGNDYLRSQLSDLRKFFDRDSKAYQVRDLTAVVDPKVKEEHENLYRRWNANFDAIANKLLLHLERDYIPPEGVSGQILDAYIDDMDMFLYRLIGALTNAGYGVEYIVRDKTSFQDLNSDAIKFFSGLGN